MTNLVLSRMSVEDGKLELIKELRSDPAFLDGMKRGIEACRKGDVVSWDKVSVELGLSQ